MKNVKFYNEKGNVRGGVRNAIAKQFKNKITQLLETLEIIESDRGTLMIPLAQTEKNEVIYGEIKVTITTKPPFEEQNEKEIEEEINIFKE